jgi:hypothetical protein
MTAIDNYSCGSDQSGRSHRAAGIQEALMAQDSIKDDYSQSQKVAGIGNFAAATVWWVAGVLTVFQGISGLSDDQLIVPVRLCSAHSDGLGLDVTARPEAMRITVVSGT